jgi:hypothetical protein
MEERPDFNENVNPGLCRGNRGTKSGYYTQPGVGSKLRLIGLSGPWRTTSQLSRSTGTALVIGYRSTVVMQQIGSSHGNPMRIESGYWPRCYREKVTVIITQIISIFHPNILHSFSSGLRIYVSCTCHKGTITLAPTNQIQRNAFITD